MKCPLPGCFGTLRHVLRRVDGFEGYICDDCKGTVTLNTLEVAELKKTATEMGKRECNRCGYWHSPGERCPIDPQCSHTAYEGYQTCPKCSVVTNHYDIHNCLLDPPKDEAVNVAHTRSAVAGSLAVTFNEDGSVTIAPK